MKKLAAYVVSCLLAPALYFAVGLDDWSGASQNVSFEVTFVSLGLVVAALAFALGRHKAFLLVPSVYVLFMLALPFIEFSPVKPAVRVIHEIRTGMNESQVRAVIDRHFPEHGRFKRPEIGPLHENVLSFVLDPADGRYNAAVVPIKFSEGKCVSAEFLPD